MEINNIDIFCEVIDNYGDVGVAYRLAREFKRIYPFFFFFKGVCKTPLHT